MATWLDSALARVLSVWLPLAERRTLAAERQAVATEALAQALQFLLQLDPDYLQYLHRDDPPADPPPPDVDASSGTERDQQIARLEALATLYWDQHGIVLDDEALIAEYDRLYQESTSRLSSPAH